MPIKGLFVGVSDFVLLFCCLVATNLKCSQNDYREESDDKNGHRAPSQALKGPLNELINLVNPRFDSERWDDVILVCLLEVTLQTRNLHAVTHTGEVGGCLS